MPKTGVCTRSVHRCRDLNAASETNQFHSRLQNQCTKARSRKPTIQKELAVAMRAAPTVAHHRRRYGLAPQVSPKYAVRTISFFRSASAVSLNTTWPVCRT